MSNKSTPYISRISFLLFHFFNVIECLTIAHLPFFHDNFYYNTVHIFSHAPCITNHQQIIIGYILNLYITNNKLIHTHKHISDHFFHQLYSKVHQHFVLIYVSHTSFQVGRAKMPNVAKLLRIRNSEFGKYYLRQILFCQIYVNNDTILKYIFNLPLSRFH